MRELETVQTKENLNAVIAVDEKGIGGANHAYMIEPLGVAGAASTLIRFQNGPRKAEDSVTGVLDSDLLEIVKDRLTGFQEGEFANSDTAEALIHVRQALQALNYRVEQRIARNVLGTYTK